MASSLLDISTICHTLQADAALLDLFFREGNALEEGRNLLARHVVRAVVFLDDHWAIARADRVLRQPGFFYFSREEDFADVLGQVQRFLAGRRMDLGASGVIVGHAAWNVVRDELAQRDLHGFMRLSSKEREVMAQLARGQSVKEAAAFLGLSESTVDNHKARLMKKLHLHRSSQLTRIAMQIGLID